MALDGLTLALLALQPLLSSSGMPLHLKPNAREKKNFGGRDTIGQSVGAECGTRATSLLRTLAGAEDFARCEQAAQFDVTEVEQQWWVTAAESKEEVDVPRPACMCSPRRALSPQVGDRGREQGGGGRADG